MKEGKVIKILLAGDTKYLEMFAPFFEKKGFRVLTYEQIEESNKPEKDVDLSLIFSKHGIHGTEDYIKELSAHLNSTCCIIPVLGNRDFVTVDRMYKLNIHRMSFEFNPERLYEEIKMCEGCKKKSCDDVERKNNYRIHFYENKGTFLIDVSGSLQKEKLIALKLMFKNYLGVKIKKLRGIVYIFNDIDEATISFQTIWSLFRFWPEIGLEFGKVKYLSSSEEIINRVHEFIEPLGVKHFSNLLNIARELYPELAKKDELEVFEFSSELIQINSQKR